METITIKNLTNVDLQQYVVKKASKNKPTSKRGIIIKEIRSGSITINYYSEIFKMFKYITFYLIDDLLLMELSNVSKENAYAITKKHNSSMQTSLKGGAKEQLKGFCGEYRNVNFYNRTKSNPLLYITKK